MSLTPKPWHVGCRCGYEGRWPSVVVAGVRLNGSPAKSLNARKPTRCCRERQCRKVVLGGYGEGTSERQSPGEQRHALGGSALPLPSCPKVGHAWVSPRGCMLRVQCCDVGMLPGEGQKTLPGGGGHSTLGLKMHRRTTGDFLTGKTLQEFGCLRAHVKHLKNRKGGVAFPLEKCCLCF